MRKFNVLITVFIFSIVFSSCGNKKETSGDTTKDTETNKTTTTETNDKTNDEKKTESNDEKVDEAKLTSIKSGLTTILSADMKDLTDKDKKFIFSEADLNDDGTMETLVMMQGPYFCGTGGCTIYLLDGDYKEISKFTVSNEPIKIAETSSKGWKDLLITSEGKLHVMKSNGKKYPMNPSVEPEYTGDGKKDVDVKFSKEYPL